MARLFPLVLLALLGLAGASLIGGSRAVWLIVGAGLSAAAIAYPEAGLALFIAVGAFKAELVGFMPEWIDPTGLLAGLVAAGAALRVLRHKSRIGPPAMLLLPFAVLVVAMFLSALGPDVTGYGVEKLARFVLLTGLAAFAPWVVIRTEGHLRRFFAVIVLLGLLMVAFGTVVGEGLRAFGATHIATGRIIGFALIAALYFLIGNVERRKLKVGPRASPFALRAFQVPLLVAVAALLAAGLLYSGSRGSIVALAAGLAAVALVSFALKTGRRWVTAGLALISGLVLAILLFMPSAAEMMNRRVVGALLHGGSVGSVRGRIQRAEDALALIAAHPLTGVGIGGFDTARGLDSSSRGDYPHNILLETGCELGLPGLLALLLFLIAGLRAAVRSVGRSRSRAGFAVAAAALLTVVYFLVNAFFSGDLNDNRMLFTAVGLCFAVGRIGDNA